MCKYYKHKSESDTVQTPAAVLRKMGIRKRYSRNRVYQDADW